MAHYIAAAVQMCSGPDRAHNLARASALVREAAARRARLVVLPEVMTWRGLRDAEAENSEPIPGPSTDAMASLARECSIYVCMGSFLERSNSSRPYNTSCLFDPNGTLIASYRKIHL